MCVCSADHHQYTFDNPRKPEPNVYSVSLPRFTITKEGGGGFDLCTGVGHPTQNSPPPLIAVFNSVLTPRLACSGDKATPRRHRPIDSLASLEHVIPSDPGWWAGDFDTGYTTRVKVVWDDNSDWCGVMLSCIVPIQSPIVSRAIAKPFLCVSSLAWRNRRCRCSFLFTMLRF